MKNDEKTPTVETAHALTKPANFRNKDEAREYWALTQELLENAYYRLAALYKSNVWDLSDLPDKDKVNAGVELKHRLLDLAALLRFAENTGRTWVRYEREVDVNGEKKTETTFTPVSDSERMVIPRRGKVDDLVRLVDHVINYEPEADSVDDTADFVPFEI